MDPVSSRGEGIVKQDKVSPSPPSGVAPVHRDHEWPVRLFRRSVLKQTKFAEITQVLGETHALHCLDIGSDNGVISYLLRKEGGGWKSADLDPVAVSSISDLVKEKVFLIDGRSTPFDENEFDRVVIVDFLEHTRTDREFIGELFRIIKPGGELIVNVPHLKKSLLRRFRMAIGQTDEKHGHVRPGYTLESLQELFGAKFELQSWTTYSKFFSEFIDTMINFAHERLKGKNPEHGSKGLILTGADLKRHERLFKIYSLIYPVVWIFSKLDAVLFFCSGYMLLVKARVNKAGGETQR